MRDLDWSDYERDGELSDLDQFEGDMLRRDYEIDQYDHWWYEEGGELQIRAAKFETLVSWYCYEERCIRCGEFKSADKTSADKKWYQLECGHYCPRWDYDHDWDPEMGWVPKQS
jgi:hypothetical protein